MKNFILITVFLTIVLHSFGQCSDPCGSNNTMSTDPAYLQAHPDPCLSGNRANTFDWTHDAFYFYKPEIAGTPYTIYPVINTPFIPANSDDPYYKNYLYTIEDVTGIIRHNNKPEDGWELVKRDLGFLWDADGNYLASSLQPVNVGNHNIAYLILYNKYTSVLRVLGYIPNTVTIPSIPVDIQIKLSFKNPDNTENYLPNALFSHYSYDEVHDKTVTQSLDMPTTVTLLTSTAHWETSNSWFFADFMMAYDPCICHDASAINVEFKAITTGGIYLQGNFYGVEQPITTVNANNNAVSWLSSVNSHVTGRPGEVQPVAGMQTYGLAATMAEEYEEQMEQYEHDELIKERKEATIDGIKTFLNMVKTGFTFAVALRKAAPDTKAEKLTALETEPEPEPETETTTESPEWLEALDVISEGLDFFSSGTSSSQPAMPFVVMGEMALTGTMTFTNDLPASGFTFITPGSKNSEENGYPEFAGACSSPVYPTACTQSPLLPEYTYYTKPLGNFAVVKKPVITYDGGSAFHFDGGSLEYVYNPAVPVDEQKSSVRVAIVVNLHFLNEESAAAMNNNIPNSGFKDLIKIDDLNYQLMTKLMTLEEIGSIIPTYAPEFDHGLGYGYDIKSVYLKVAATLIFKPDPRYPSEDLKGRVIVSTYPVELREQYPLSITDGMNAFSNCSSQMGQPTFYTANEYSASTFLFGCDPIVLQGAHIADPGAKVYVYGNGDIIVDGTLSGEFVLVPYYNTPNVPFPVCSKVGPVSPGQVDCAVNQYQANTYKAGIAPSRISENAIDNSFTPESGTEYFLVSPNPASQSVKFSYETREDQDIKLFITDFLGNVVKSVTDFSAVESSKKEVEVDISELSSGTYFCVFYIGEYREVKKLMVVK